jgi:hypothetical protein
MKKLIIIIILAFAISPIHSQTWGWVRTAGGNNPDEVSGLLIDNNNNVYLSGSIMNPSAIFNNIPVGVNGFNDGFVAKYNSAGMLQWVNGYGGYNPYATFDGVSSVMFNKDTSAIYLSGTFYGDCYIGTYHLAGHSGTDRDVFIAKLDLNGNCIWAKSMGGFGNDLVRAGVVNSEGNILLTLIFPYSGIVDTFYVAPPRSLVCFDSSGSCLWVKPVANNASFYPVIHYGRDYILTGSNSTAEFSIDTMDFNLPDYHGRFLTRIDSNCSAQWVVVFGGPRSFDGPFIQQNDSGDILFCGVSKGPYLTIGVDTVYSPKDYILYLSCSNQNGEVIWTKSILSNGQLESRGIFVSDNSDIYLLGGYRDTTNFESGIMLIPDTAGLSEFFIAKFNNIGVCQNVITLRNIEGRSIAGSTNGSIYFAGQFREPCIVGDTQLSSFGGYDIILGQLLSLEDIYYPNPGGDQLLIYANPTAGSCNIQIPEEFLGESNLLLSIFGLDGKIIQQQNIIIAENKILLDIEARAKGVYVATLSNGKKVYTGKIVFE